MDENLEKRRGFVSIQRVIIVLVELIRHVVDGRCVIDAKSLNGVLSLGLYKDFDVYIHTNDEDIMEAFNNIILNFKEEINEGSMYIWEG